MLHNDPAVAKKFGCECWQVGDSTQVQSNLLNQHETLNAVEGVLDDIKSAVRVARVDGEPVPIVPVYCTAGNHRSHGVALMIQKRILNEATNQYGDRIFNCNVFRIQGV